MTELAKAYDPKGVEERWYSFWDEKGYFKGETGASGDPFAIVIPPPNVTGVLHIGHALNNSIQDSLIRRARMQGRPTLWVPGTDHAAIATQAVLERKLASEGKSRFDLGRKGFEALFWEWKEEYEGRILGQLRRLGASCDWTHTRFTMDPGLSNAVRTVFVRLYDEGYIYRGNRIINWCPTCMSAISDIEVNHEDVEGEIVTLRYPLTFGDGHIDVATTRVETMLGDTGVAVSPNDERYKDLIGKTVTLPLSGRVVPIVADEAVDAAFGTGAVKVTPAHDPTDFEIAERQGLEKINIFDATATVNENGGRFAGLNRYDARKAVLEALREEGVVVSEERPYVHAVGHCDRSGDEVEPWLSEQWFVAMKDLARPAIDVVKSGKVTFAPEMPYTKMYLDWMENIRDWCISRQLWLGHRIPAWYCPDGHITVAMDDPTKCSTCGKTDLKQDEDTLDTWFSSGLWPFSTLGWPEMTKDLLYWYPTNVLSTAREIIYLWVARMIFLGLHFVGDIPFEKIFIHPMVRDEHGRKMSKSVGNVIDPLDVMEQYGTDATRFALLGACTLALDISFAEDRVEGARRFCNKLWNATRFVLGTRMLGDSPPSIDGVELGLPERWILSRLERTKEALEHAYAEFDFSEAADAVYHFVWSEFCDWYLEMAKLGLGSRREAVAATLYHVLDEALRLAHPMIPFITEELWQKLPKRPDDPESVAIARWPVRDASRDDPDAERHVAFLQELVGEIRSFRHEHKIAPRQRIAVTMEAGDQEALLRASIEELKALAALESVEFGPQPSGWSRLSAAGVDVFVALGELVDTGAERERLERAVAESEKLVAAANAKLSNERFTSGAPADVVEKVRTQLAEHTARAEQLRAQLASL
jgi:valyl-tRNA synthetase